MQKEADYMSGKEGIVYLGSSDSNIDRDRNNTAFSNGLMDVTTITFGPCEELGSHHGYPDSLRAVNEKQVQNGECRVSRLTECVDNIAEQHPLSP